MKEEGNGKWLCFITFAMLKWKQGKGLGKEVLKLILNYIKTFPYGEVESVYASWHPDNKASEKVCLANGFVIVGKDEDGAVISRVSI